MIQNLPTFPIRKRYGSWILPLLVALVSLGSHKGSPNLALACTSIVVGKDASADGSTMCTHNADCLNCDFRLGRVPAQDWPPGSERPVVKLRSSYPRTVVEDRGTTWTPANLDPMLPQRDVWASKEWRDAMVIGHIPQVNHTFAYLEGLYGIMNEKQVGIGESTCAAKWFAGPVDEDCERCNALFDISELSRVALERASTAREAIQIMGDLAEEHGFYGSVWDPASFLSYFEAGEALTVTDPKEAWMFHILPDDTSTSAVWVAQRVPDDHVSVVANQFVIKEVEPEADPDEWMFSSNMFEVAERAGGYDYKRDSGAPLHFTRAFYNSTEGHRHYSYSTRRMWRVLDTVAPSLTLLPYTDSLAESYPFSAKPDKPVRTQDVLRLVRDHYEGTPFDLTRGLVAGPYGDVDRYDPGPSLDGSTDMKAAFSGLYERSISLFRTSYSSVAQSRSYLPDKVGALLWVAQYKPSMSTFVPFYVAMHEVPHPYTIGSLFRYSREASYWTYSVVGNWAERYRAFAHVDVVAQQKALEGPLFAAQQKVETNATKMVSLGDVDGAVELLTRHSNTSATVAVSAYQKLFYTLVARYHDGFQLQDPTAETIDIRSIFYPKVVLEESGFFHTVQDDVKASEDAGAIREVMEMDGVRGSIQEDHDLHSSDKHGGGWVNIDRPPQAFVVELVLVATSTLILGFIIGRLSLGRPGYESVPE